MSVRVLLGVGNRFRGDDGAGSYAAELINRKKGWIGVDGGMTPENFTGLVKEYAPDEVVIVDAAELGLKPGEFRELGEEEIPKACLSTHGMPLSLLVSYLKNQGIKVKVVGIQTKTVSDKTELSKEVKAGVEKLVTELSF